MLNKKSSGFILSNGQEVDISGDIHIKDILDYIEFECTEEEAEFLTRYYGYDRYDRDEEPNFRNVRYYIATNPDLIKQIALALGWAIVYGDVGYREPSIYYAETPQNTDMKKYEEAGWKIYNTLPNAYWLFKEWKEEQAQKKETSELEKVDENIIYTSNRQEKIDVSKLSDDEYWYGLLHGVYSDDPDRSYRKERESIFSSRQNSRIYQFEAFFEKAFSNKKDFRKACLLHCCGCKIKGTKSLEPIIYNNEFESIIFSNVDVNFKNTSENVLYNERGINLDIERVRDIYYLNYFLNLLTVEERKKYTSFMQLKEYSRWYLPITSSFEELMICFLTKVLSFKKANSIDEIPMMDKKKMVYLFNEGNKNMYQLLGVKGANLAELTNIGVRVPVGFTITTEATKKIEEDEILKQVEEYLKKLENLTNKKFGCDTNPLTVSVRSGAPISMPGMLDSILNIGITEEFIEKNVRGYDGSFTMEIYLRFIQEYSIKVKHIPVTIFSLINEELCKKKNVNSIYELKGYAQKELALEYKKLYQEYTGEVFPNDVKKQIFESIKMVINSWNKTEAKRYRVDNGISDSLGTAVSIQEMVYGNLDRAGSIVVFSRNPQTGSNGLYGEYLPNSQGADIVNGTKTPLIISETELRKINYYLYDDLSKVVKKIENHFGDMQEVEITYHAAIREDRPGNKIHVLQNRKGARTKEAALKIAIDMVNEEMITQEEALQKIGQETLSKLSETLLPTFDPEETSQATIITRGNSVSKGVISGRLYYDIEEAIQIKLNSNDNVILVRTGLQTEEYEGLSIADGIITNKGGITSHASIVALSMGIPCICGTDLIEKENNFKSGDIVSLDATNGILYLGEIKQLEPELDENYATLMSWIGEGQKVMKLKKANIFNKEEKPTIITPV